MMADLGGDVRVIHRNYSKKGSELIIGIALKAEWLGINI